MNNIAVIYKSNYGSTEKYAKEISLKVKGDLFDITYLDPSRLKYYNTIIFGSGLYAGSMNGINFLVKNYDLFKSKSIIIFAVGLFSPNENMLNKLLNKNLPTTITNNIKFFYFRGGMNYSKLSFLHRTMMRMAKVFLKLKSKKELDEDLKLILSTYGRSIDLIDLNSVEPLLLYVKKLS